MSVWWKIKTMNAQTTYWAMLFSKLHMHLGNKQKREHWLIFSRFFYQLIFSGWLLFNKLPLRKIKIQLIFYQDSGVSKTTFYVSFTANHCSQFISLNLKYIDLFGLPTSPKKLNLTMAFGVSPSAHCALSRFRAIDSLILCIQWAHCPYIGI